MGFVYLIRHGAGDQFKVGRAANPQQRIKQLQTTSPVRLSLFDAIETEFAVEGEKYLHDLLRDRRMVGENFRVSPEELETFAARTRIYLAEELPRIQEARASLRSWRVPRAPRSSCRRPTSCA